MKPKMTPAEHGEQVAATWPPLAATQVEEIAKILAADESKARHFAVLGDSSP